MVKTLVSLLFAATLCGSAYAANPKAVIEELGMVDRSFMERQIDSIDQLARTRLGNQLRGNMSDLDLLQTIINQSLIPDTDTEALQALGAVMGRVLEADLPSLQWKIYIDRVGRSRALCITGTQHCLFPMTMLSRRMSTGLKPDVHKVYEGAIDLIEEHLPHAPYGGDLLRNFHPR
jgi:hypothetical protein